VNTRQLNRDGTEGNQLVAWSNAGLFDVPLGREELARATRLFGIQDRSASLVDRVRSYLDANCGFCHRPGALAQLAFDLRWETPLETSGLLGARRRWVVSPAHQEHIVVPSDPGRSLLLAQLRRANMPPLGVATVDRDAVELLSTWIASLDGPRALAPPQIVIEGRAARRRVHLRHSDRGVQLWYTTDGSSPTAGSSPCYDGPFEIPRHATVRVRARKPGHRDAFSTRSSH
jgi:hypothetical protein